MASLDTVRRLIVNADDFGRSSEINQAIVRAHREGVLTTASLMVNGEAVAEAVKLARENPGLGVGLHLTLVCGRSTLVPGEISGLVDSQGRFSDWPVYTGCRYFFQRRLRPQLQREIQAQFEKFAATGLLLDHVNGHLNFHLHPTVFRILKHNFQRLGVHRLRITRDPFWLNVRLASGRWFYRISHAVIFSLLCGRIRDTLRRHRILHTRAVFGLLQNGRVNERYLLRLLPRLPDGDSEVYSHPCLAQFKEEFEALVSPKVKQLAVELGIQRIRYQDL